MGISMKIKIILALFVITFFVSCDSNDKYKNYVINHSDEIYMTEYGVFKIDSCEIKYYTDISIRTTELIFNDTAYSIIFWGDRNSWKWKYKKDKYFNVDVKYNRYNGENVDKDLMILYTLELIKLKNK